MTSRFSVVTAPARDPGVCYVTRTSVGPFIDTGIDMSTTVIDRGRLYLSVDVIREMAQVAGLFDEGKSVSVALQEKEWYDRGYNEAIKELKNDVVDNFVQRVLIDSASNVSNAAPVAPESNDDTAGAAISGAEDTVGGAHKVTKVNDGPQRKGTGTGSIKRPVSVSTNPSDESEFRL